MSALNTFIASLGSLSRAPFRKQKNYLPRVFSDSIRTHRQHFTHCFTIQTRLDSLSKTVAPFPVALDARENSYAR